MGDHIERIAERKGTKAAAERRRLWTFVSTFTENNMNGPKLMSIYQRLALGEHTSAADHNLLATGRAGKSRKYRPRALNQPTNLLPAGCARHARLLEGVFRFFLVQGNKQS